ncbi:LuxR C-terminal-related transcriptional regulator [Streptomyces sp. KL2]|uniref:response regulator transcription factor n=1 Tax=Streptomyces sp. KL2 TaxID=3050126 RepID=UPI0039780CBD
MDASHALPGVRAARSGTGRTRIAFGIRDRAVREGLRADLCVNAEIEVVGAVGRPGELTALLRTRAVDVAVADIALRSGNFTDWLGGLRGLTEATAAELALFSLTVPAVEVVEYAAEAGVRSFVCGDDLRWDAVAVVRMLRSDAGWVSPAVGAALLRHRSGSRAGRAAVDESRQFMELTGREQAVLPLINEGFTDAQIARRLHVSESTIKYHVGNLLSKWGARNRTHLVHLAGQSARRRAVTCSND